MYLDSLGLAVLSQARGKQIAFGVHSLAGNNNMETTSEVVHFGAFEVDLRTGELRKHGLKLRLPRQSFQVLVLLLQHPGQLVSREELRERLWPADTFVDFDHGLNAAVNRLREALGDSAEKPRFIETLPRRGYRFLAPVTAPLECLPVSTTASGTSVMAAAATPAAEDKQQTANASADSDIGTRRAKMLQRTWRKVLLAAAVLLIAAGGMWWRLPAPRPQYAIAVLPFKNLSSEPNSDYFSDGLTDEIIRDLSNIDGLQVKSRTSSFVFKDKPRDVRDAGKQLGANLLLEGSVLRAGERLRINVDLVRVADDSTLWSQRYDRDLRDIFAVQDEISRSIVNELRLKHFGGKRRYDTNLEAYDLYLRAQSFSNTNSGPKRAGTLPLYRQVIATAPDFAPAYAGLALVYADLRNPRLALAAGITREEAAQQLRAMAEKAIQLDPLLPEAHGALGTVYASDLAWGDAERSFQRALQLNPNLARIHQSYGIVVLLPEGKVAEAVQQFREAVTLDPLSDSPRYALAFGLISAGSYEEALENCRRALAANPGDAGLMWLQARAMWFKGEHQEAIAMFEQQGPTSRGSLGYAYGSIGRRREAEQLLAEQDPSALRHQVFIYAGLGKKDRVMESLEKLAAEHDGLVDLYPLFPELAFMRDDARMKEFRHRRNLPWPP